MRQVHIENCSKCDEPKPSGVVLVTSTVTFCHISTSDSGSMSPKGPFTGERVLRPRRNSGPENNVVISFFSAARDRKLWSVGLCSVGTYFH